MTPYANANRQTKILIVFACLLIMLGLGIWLGSLTFAAAVNLGSKSFFTLINYTFDFARLTSGQKIWLSVSWFVAVIPLILILVIAIKSRKFFLHGKAGFATKSEIKKAGLLANKGILCGRFNNEYLYFDGTEHVIVYAPTRSGKGVGVVIPNLLTWQDSVVVFDIKKENWFKTAGFRKAHGIDVFLFDPDEENGVTHRYNPLTYVRRNTKHQIGDLQRIANFLIPVASDKDPFFDLSAQKAFVAVTSYLAETPSKPFTIGQTYKELTSQSDMRAYFRNIIETRRNADIPLSEPTINALNDFLSTSDDTLASIRATVTSRLGLWANPVVDAATSASDFNFNDLRRKRISIYVGITPDNLTRFAPLINLFFQQVMDINLRTLPENDKTLNRKLLLLMDEFTAMGKMEVINKGIAFFAGYNIRVLIVIQSPSQLEEVYGKDAAKSMMTNCAVEIVFTPKELDVAQQLSERIGYNTVISKSISKPSGFSKGNKNTTLSDQRRALMLPQEIMQISDEKALLFRRGIPPILANKIRYYKEKGFAERHTIPAPIISPLVERSEQISSEINGDYSSASIEVLADMMDKIKPRNNQFRVTKEEVDPLETISDIELEASYGDVIKSVQAADSDEALLETIRKAIS
ncbi:MAG: type IV secretory system conjugative DNA transfer family protein [Alphaproteobacteria bacterium]|nr:type IV secretory system conjugative DNA transfer family protein [Alphaproteobacteria bacterium]